MSQILKQIILFPIWLYQYAISPFLPRTCRYHPTCSSYMKEAVEKYGVLKGLYLGLSRILRCHPFSAHCYHDPVPSAFTWADLLRYKRLNKKINKQKRNTEEA